MNDPTTPAEQPIHYQICCPKLPLAVYREVAAHLRQIRGVTAGLLPQMSQQFDYEQSQIGGVWVELSGDAEPRAHERVEEILAYYSDRHGVWETVSPQCSS